MIFGGDIVGSGNSDIIFGGSIYLLSILNLFKPLYL